MIKNMPTHVFARKKTVDYFTPESRSAGEKDRYILKVDGEYPK